MVQEPLTSWHCRMGKDQACRVGSMACKERWGLRRKHLSRSRVQTLLLFGSSFPLSDWFLIALD